MWQPGRVGKVFAVAALVAASVAALYPGAEAAPEGATERVSVASDGSQGDDASAASSLSAHGRFVAFASDATNLVTGDGNAASDVFVADRSTGDVERVSVSSGEAEAPAGGSGGSISDGGRFVAFLTTSPLDPDDTNGVMDVYVRDRANGTTELASVSSDEDVADAASSSPSISGNGRFVAFASDATNLVAGDANAKTDVFVRDLADGTTEIASVSSSEAQGTETSFSPAISGDGNHVAFASGSPNLTPDADGTDQIFVRDLDAGTTTLASKSSGGDVGNDSSLSPAINGDGSVVAFRSIAKNLVGGDTNDVSDIFARDLDSGTTSRVSVSSSGEQGNAATDGTPAVDTLGRFVVYASPASNLVAGDSNGADDVFRHDMSAGETIRVSVGSQADGTSSAPDIADGGAVVTFTSAATNLVSGDTNGVTDVFARVLEPSGYYVLDDAGGVFSFGDAPFFGSIPGLRNAGQQIGDARGVDLAVTPTGQGYYVLDDAGGVFTFGDAEFFGSIPGLRQAGQQIGDAQGVDIAVTPTGEGYYVLDDAGGVFTFGDAEFFGSIPGLRQGGQQIGQAEGLRIETSPDGDGYYVLDDVGGVFTFGDAEFFGSIPGLRQAGQNIGDADGVGLAVTPSGQGYYVLDDAGGVFTFGDSEFFGSIPGLRQAGQNIGDADGIDLAVTPSGQGYYVLDNTGGVFTFGDAAFFGSVPGLRQAGQNIGQAEGLRIEVVA